MEGGRGRKEKEIGSWVYMLVSSCLNFSPSSTDFPCHHIIWGERGGVSYREKESESLRNRERERVRG